MALCLIYTGGSDGNICISHAKFEILHLFLMHFYCTYGLVAKCSTLFCHGITSIFRSNPQYSSLFQGLRILFRSWISV